LNYFDEINLKYQPPSGKNIFISDDYYLNKEENLLEKPANLLLFKQSYIRSNRNYFYLNINLLSGKYNDFEEIKNKSIKLLYGLKIRENIHFGAEGNWYETSNENLFDYKNSFSRYFLFLNYRYKLFSFTLKYYLNGNKKFKNNFDTFFTFNLYRDILGLRFYLGSNPDFLGIRSYIKDIFGPIQELNFVGNVIVKYPPYIKIYFLYHQIFTKNYDFEVTMSIFDKAFFQFYWSDQIEAKRLIFKFPIYKNYHIIFGPEFYNIYYFNFSFMETTKQHTFIITFKHTLKIDVKRNFSLFLRYIYFI
jgi:hypothetical protein